jgi:hypothetical protein
MSASRRSGWCALAQQFLLRGRSLEQLALEATELYGVAARIVRAERVLDAGLAGFLGRRHVEVTVQVPNAGNPRVGPVEPAVHVLPGRSGIAALLDSADTREDDVNAPIAGRSGTRRPGQPVSTESSGFAELLTRLGDDVRAEVVPAPLSAPGDLVLVLGLEESAHGVTRSMADVPPRRGAAGRQLYSAGHLGVPGRPHLAGRWDAVAARALAVETGSVVLASCDLGAVAAGLPHLGAAAALAPDQVWLVVDARHKSDETREWVEHVRRAVGVDALAVVGAGESRSAHTVNRLGVPLGWVDGRPAPRTVL